MLGAREYKQMLELVELIYSIPDRAQMFHMFCERLEKLVPICSAAYAPADDKYSRLEVLGAMTYQAAMHPLNLFARHYAPLNPYSVLLRRNGVDRYINKATRLTDIVSLRQLKNSEYGQDFQSVAGVLYEICTVLGYAGKPVGALGLHRSKSDRDFNAHEKLILNYLVPHLARAIHYYGVTQGPCPSETAGERVLRSNGTSLFPNESVQQDLQHQSARGCLPKHGRRTTYFSTQTGIYRVDNSGQQYADGEAPPLFGKPLSEDDAIDWKLKDYGLSKRQKEIVRGAMSGLSNLEIADRLCICEQTVKDHLYDIFQRLNIHKRSQLAAKLLGFD